MGKSKKPSTGLKRAKTHEIDELASRHFRSSIPPTWVVNELKSDYGKDYHIELTDNEGYVRRAFYVQQKGTSRCKYVSNGTQVSFDLESKHSHHFFVDVKLPLFLVVIDVNANRGYWLFMQKCLAQDEKWKSVSKRTFNLPTENRLEETDQFLAAIQEAFDWMALVSQIPVRERILKELEGFKAIDSRFGYELTIDDRIESLKLIPREPVTLTIAVKSHNPRRLAQLKSELFDKGLPVTVRPGEVSVEGSALFNGIAEQGGVIQLKAHMACQLTLKLHDMRGGPVWEWQGLPGGITGGIRHHRIETRLDRSPLRLQIDSDGSSTGSWRLNIDVTKWDGQPLLALSYFDQIRRLCSEIAKLTSMEAVCEFDGNAWIVASTILDQSKDFGPISKFLDLIDKAREIARRYGLKIRYSMEHYEGDSLSRIEVAYSIMTTGSYIMPWTDLRFEVSVSKDVARLLRAEGAIISNMVLVIDQNYKFMILGTDLCLGSLAWDVSEASVETSPEELDRILHAPDAIVSLTLRSTPNTQRILRKLSPDEIQEFEDIRLRS